MDVIGHDDEFDDGDDDRCILRVQVGMPVEMKAWIRGWGPEWLRAQIGEEMRRAAEAYRERT